MPWHRHNGYTLVELVVIIMIIGILALFVAARYGDQTSFDSRGYYDELSSAARYAQRYAIASGCGVRFQVASSNYSLTVANPCPVGVGNPVQRPDGGDFSGIAPAGVTATTGSYVYNPLGDVNSGGAITVSGGGSSHTLTITAGSGFVVAP